MIKIYLGDVTSEVKDEAQKDSTDATLITSENCYNLRDGVYYLSFGDMNGIKQFVDTLSQADEIIYAPPISNQWSDYKNDHSMMQHWTEFYLRFFKDKKIVRSQVPLHKDNNFLDLADPRKGQTSQLWIAGCSITHGVGVEKHQRYGEIIANNLDLPVSFLTTGGSSVEWAADQLLRSDIRKGDIVVWGVTSFSRFSYFSNNSIKHITIRYYEKNLDFHKIINIDRLSDENQLYRGVIKIYQVLNHCKKIGAKIYFAGILVDAQFISYLVNLPNYTQFYGYPGLDLCDLFLDFGTDGEHPGKLTHEWYADTLLQKIKNNTEENKV